MPLAQLDAECKSMLGYGDGVELLRGCDALVPRQTRVRLVRYLASGDYREVGAQRRVKEAVVEAYGSANVKDKDPNMPVR